MIELNKFVVKQIGTVRNRYDVNTQPDDWGDVVSEIEVNKRYQKALFRLDQFKSIIVVFWFHKESRTKLQLHPRGDLSRPIRGAFATHTQKRPNKLGVTEVELLSVNGNKLKVKGLDAINGTPVIDIKSGKR